MLGLESGKLELHPYTDAWHQLYINEEREILTVIGNQIEDIQHVGSTAIAVPGMLAKPILDIAIHIDQLDRVAACIPALATLGYTYKGEYGIPGRHYFRKGTPRTHHLHMMLPGCPNRENQVLFRDYLIEHPEEALAYAQLKKKLIDSDIERHLYSEAKGPFIAKILDKAKPANNHSNR